MTADYIAFHAAERPEAIALTVRGRAISYARMSGDLGRVTGALRALGLSAGSAVAVGSDDLYVHWLLLLGLERLGVASASYLAEEGELAAPLLASVDLVLSEPHFPRAQSSRHRAITPEWLAGVLAQPAEAGSPAPRAASDPVRIVRTSGTTGQSKRLLLLRAVQDAWIDRWIWFLSLTRGARYLLTMPLTVNAVYTVMAAVLRVGGTVVSDAFESSAALARAIAAASITDIVLLPIHLKQLLDSLPAGFEKPPGLTVTIIGGAAPEALREQAMARLAGEMIIGYGANEMPFITQMRSTSPEGVGVVLPWVQAEVVDDDHRPLPAGSLGRIRARTDVMAAGYLGDPEASRRMFRDGWFYPGDVGILRGGRLLQVVGRADDLLNIGGNKLSPSALEGLILRHVGAGDVGVCSMRNPHGIEEVCVALVDPRDPEPRLIAGIAEAFARLELGKYHLVTLDRIPRNAVGKIDRGRLKAAVAARGAGGSRDGAR
jgi:2,3-dihydroxybenzoate-AMP ligase